MVSTKIISWLYKLSMHFATFILEMKNLRGILVKNLTSIFSHRNALKSLLFSEDFFKFPDTMSQNFFYNRYNYHFIRSRVDDRSRRRSRRKTIETSERRSRGSPCTETRKKGSKENKGRMQGKWKRNGSGNERKLENRERRKTKRQSKDTRTRTSPGSLFDVSRTDNEMVI